MNHNDLIAAIAERSGSSKAETRRILKSLAETMQAELESGGTVRLAGIGTFDQKWTEPRLVRGVRSGRRRMIDGHHRLRFKASSLLRDAVRGRTNSPLKDPAHQDAWRLADTLLSDLAAYGMLDGLTLEPDAEDASVRNTLSTMAGPEWDAAVEAYESRISADLRSQVDHLALAAKQRFR